MPGTAGHTSLEDVGSEPPFILEDGQKMKAHDSLWPLSEQGPSSCRQPGERVRRQLPQSMTLGRATGMKRKPNDSGTQKIAPGAAQDSNELDTLETASPFTTAGQPLKPTVTAETVASGATCSQQATPDPEYYGESSRDRWSQALDDAVRWTSSDAAWGSEATPALPGASCVSDQSAQTKEPLLPSERHPLSSRDVSPSSLLETTGSVSGAAPQHDMEPVTVYALAGQRLDAGMAAGTSLSHSTDSSAGTSSQSPGNAATVVTGVKLQLTSNQASWRESAAESAELIVYPSQNDDTRQHASSRGRTLQEESMENRDSWPILQLLSEAGFGARLDSNTENPAGLRAFRQSPFNFYDSPLRQHVFVEWNTGHTGFTPEPCNAWQPMVSDAEAFRDSSPASRVFSPGLTVWATDGSPASGAELSGRDVFEAPAESPQPLTRAYSSTDAEPSVKSAEALRGPDVKNGGAGESIGERELRIAAERAQIPVSLRERTSEKALQAAADATSDMEALVADLRQRLQELHPSDHWTIWSCMQALAAGECSASTCAPCSAASSKRRDDADTSTTVRNAAETLAIQLLSRRDTVGYRDASTPPVFDSQGSTLF